MKKRSWCNTPRWACGVTCEIRSSDLDCSKTRNIGNKTPCLCRYMLGVAPANKGSWESPSGHCYWEGPATPQDIWTLFFRTCFRWCETEGCSDFVRFVYDNRAINMQQKITWRWKTQSFVEQIESYHTGATKSKGEILQNLAIESDRIVFFSFFLSIQFPIFSQ